MIGIIVAALGCLATVAALRMGAAWAVGWIYIPVFLLMPERGMWELPGLPELNGRRAVVLGIVLAEALRRVGRYSASHGGLVPDSTQQKLARTPLPAPTFFDLLVLCLVFSFATSYGFATDARGFVHKLAVLILDWVLPYVAVRTALRRPGALTAILPPIAVAATLSAAFMVFEARMATRLAAEIWSAVAGIDVPSHWQRGAGYRWGYLRAFATFGHPIAAGTIFVGLAPLLALGAQIEGRWRPTLLVGFLACLAGCLASVSRGPILVMLVSGLFFPVLGLRMRRTMALGSIALLAASPLVFLGLQDAAQHTRESLEERGNVESGHYRLALLMIYGAQLQEVGWFGDVSVVGSEYEKAYSVDNSYLYQAVVGGWAGGGLFLLTTGAACVVSLRRTVRARGRERRRRACIAASVCALSLCLGNVFFSADFAPLYFMLVGLVANEVGSGRATLRRRVAAEAAPPRVERRVAAGGASLGAGLRRSSHPGRSGPG